MSIVEILSKYQQAFLSGIAVTLALAGIVWFAGISLGGLGGVLARRYRLFDLLIRLPNFLLSSMPVLVVLFWVHYPLQSMLGVVIDPFISTAVVLSFYNVFGIASMVHSFLKEIPKEYSDVAKVNGIKPSANFFKIELPILFRMATPSLLVSQVNVLHLTLFGSLISVEEIFRVCQQVNSQVYQPVEVYSALAVFFVLICMPLNGLAHFIKTQHKRPNY